MTRHLIKHYVISTLDSKIYLTFDQQGGKIEMEFNILQERPLKSDL